MALDSRAEPLVEELLGEPGEAQPLQRVPQQLAVQPEGVVEELAEDPPLSVEA